MIPASLAVLSIIAAGWPVWRWYGDRLGDGGDEPLGLVPLAIAGIALARAGRGTPDRRWTMAALLGLGLFAALTAVGTPPLLRAAVLLPVLACALRGILGWRLEPGVIALALLSLPVIASLQFWAGGPLRHLTALLATALTALAGVPVEREGVVLLVAGEPVVVDGPCSGIRLLWTACVAMAAVAAWLGWGWRRTAAGVAAAVVAAVLANGWRAASLTLGAHGLLPTNEWLHTARAHRPVAVALTACFLVLRPRASIPPEPGEPEGGLPVRSVWPFPIVAVIAFLAPFTAPGPAVRVAEGFPGWPDHWDGRALTPLPASAADMAAAAGFPGRIARFATEDRHVVLRWIPTGTRSLHPAADCLRAAGWTVITGAPTQDDRGWWSTLRAHKDGRHIRVREQIRAADGRTWTDPSLWWWQAGDHPGGFWAVTEEQAGE